MQLRKVDTITLIAVVLTAMILLGELGAYVLKPNDYGASASWNGGDLGYTVYSNGSDGYDVVSMLDTDPVSELYIYLDEDFEKNIGAAGAIARVMGFDQRAVADQLEKQLSFRGVTQYTEVDSSGLRDFILSTESDPAGKALFVAGYSLPASVYTGDPSDPIINWISNGGRLYWTASEIGRIYNDGDGVHEVSGNQMLFLGAAACIFTDSARATEVDGSGYCRVFALRNNVMSFAASTAIPNSLSMGYVYGGYASVSVVGKGSGEVCLFSGDLTMEHIGDMAQVIASGVSSGTSVVGTASGELKGGVSGSIAGPSDSVYIYVGGINTVYGRYFHA